MQWEELETFIISIQQLQFVVAFWCCILASASRLSVFLSHLQKKQMQCSEDYMIRSVQVCTEIIDSATDLLQLFENVTEDWFSESLQ